MTPEEILNALVAENSSQRAGNDPDELRLTKIEVALDVIEGRIGKNDWCDAGKRLVTKLRLGQHT